MKDNTTDWEALAKKLEEGSIPPPPDSAEERAIQEDCEKIWQSAASIGTKHYRTGNLSLPDLNRCMEAMQQCIAASEVTLVHDTPDVENTASNRLIWKPMLRIAAGIAFIVLAGWGVYQYVELPTFTKTDTQAWVNYQTDVAPKVFALPDGSKVWLNANSTLSYPKAFEHNRAVQLSGEAYFEVVPNIDYPFSVSTQSGTLAKVLGTRFNLKAFPQEDIVRLTVAEGAVSFAASAEQTVEITANQQATFHTKQKTVTQETVETVTATAWKEGRLVLSQVTLAELVGILSRYYQVPIELQNPSELATLDFSTTSTMDFSDKSAEETLQIVTLTLGIQYRKTESGYELIP